MDTQIQQSIDAFEDMMSVVQEGIELQSEIIEEQQRKIEELERPPTCAIVTMLMIVYIYGTFLGVWMCPK